MRVEGPDLALRPCREESEEPSSEEGGSRLASRCAIVTAMLQSQDTFRCIYARPDSPSYPRFLPRYLPSQVLSAITFPFFLTTSIKGGDERRDRRRKHCQHRLLARDPSSRKPLKPNNPGAIATNEATMEPTPSSSANRSRAYVRGILGVQRWDCP